MKKVVFVNKFGPLSNAVTGQNAKELADFLNDKNIDITFICLKASYKVSGKTSGNALVNYKIIELGNYYNGNIAVIRLMVSLLDGFRLWLASLTKKCDAIIVMTDPPLLFFWFQLFRSFSKRKLFYWTMDLYPEAFVAGKFIRPRNFFYRILHKVVYAKPPDFVISLGNKQLEYLESKFSQPVPNVIIPCGLINSQNIIKCERKNSDPTKITFGYGGNIGEAHDAEFLVSFINELDSEKHEIILSLYGSKASYVKQVIEGRTNVQFKEFLSYSDISCIDINIATLLPDWNHICVPSKAVTAICCGSALLLNTNREADAWQMFKDGSWLIENGEDYKKVIKKYLVSLNRQSITYKKLMAKQLAEEELLKKKQSLEKILQTIRTSDTTS